VPSRKSLITTYTIGELTQVSVSCPVLAGIRRASEDSSHGSSANFRVPYRKYGSTIINIDALSWVTGSGSQLKRRQEGVQMNVNSFPFILLANPVSEPQALLDH
jgi:hypothetical protein